MIPFVDLEKQQERIRPQIEAAVRRVLDHGQYIMGPEVQELEEQLAEIAGVKHCVSCSSGTDALLLPLMAKGVGPGDAVFTTPFSFIAAAEVIALTGATPVFVDIDPDTYNIEPAKLADAIVETKREGALIPKAIVPVDLFGLPADYDQILPIAKDHDLFVLEDAAQAFAAEHRGQRAPSLGHAGATSFFPAKPLGCYGDGGAAFTDDDKLAEIMRSIRIHGKGADKYSNVRVGLNARMDTLQAAILLEKLAIYPEELAMRNGVADRYIDALRHVNGLKLPIIPDGHRSVWAQFSVQSEHREEIQAHLKSAGIPTAVYYVCPLHLL
ncbi:MAG: DegT/DnrJ/EryC1/StrS family aminotransferase, partial [Verrucomicrobia bacterium]|nr:DegT/DnrJ/EryC1/StrS family aminotransferase [Verrucomicrobiota bacterium]